MNPNTAADEIWKSQPQIVRRFLELRSNHEKLGEEIAYILSRLLREAGIEYSAVTWRAKSLDSFCEKVVRKKYGDPVREVTDLAGVRVVYLYGSDSIAIESLIERQLQVVEKVDRVKEADPEHFGYGAVHYLVRLGKGPIGARYDDLKDLLCEVQVRTILQDAWAIVAHHLSYKQESDVPVELRRKLNALSGLFVTADDQFDRLREERNQYSENLKREISSDAKTWLQRELNLDNLAQFLEWRFPAREQGPREDVARLLNEIRQIGYTNISDLDKVVTQTEDALNAYEKKYPPWDPDMHEQCPYSAVGALATALRFINQPFREEYVGILLPRFEEFMPLVKAAPVAH